MASNSLNSADYGRIEAALRSLIDEYEAIEAVGQTAMRRTLRKIERINKTGSFTEQHRPPAVTTTRVVTVGVPPGTLSPTE